jgi:RNA polymerase sigma-70 factor (ECF subfamily)
MPDAGESTVADDSDAALISRYAGGEAAAFELLYRRHELRVWRYLQRNLRNAATADELMQEVWFAVARDAARYRPSSSFTAWLFTIAHNRMIDHIRARRRQMGIDSPGLESDAVIRQLPADPSTSPVAAAVARDEAEALIRAVEDLPREQREAFLLQVEGDLDIEEIAKVTGSSFETTKSRLRYARTKLRQMLKEYA